jgi:hypothetical protein
MDCSNSVHIDNIIHKLCFTFFIVWGIFNNVSGDWLSLHLTEIVPFYFEFGGDDLDRHRDFEDYASTLKT